MTVWQRIKARWITLWQHRTKALGVIFAAAGYVQNNFAQSGIRLPPRWEGCIVGVAGVITFTLGAYNWITMQTRDK